MTAQRNKLYICGPMTGLPDHNYPAFARAAEQLRAAGYEVISPAENGLPPDAPWAEHMRVDIANLATHCMGLAVLPGWASSRGAAIEMGIAEDFEMHVMQVNTWLAVAATKQATL